MNRTDVEIKLDKVRHLKFGHNAFCAMEEVLGGFLTGEVLATARGQRAMLFAGLVHEDSTLTVERTGQFFDEYDPIEIMSKVDEAMRVSRPDLKETADTAPVQPAELIEFAERG